MPAAPVALPSRAHCSSSAFGEPVSQCIIVLYDNWLLLAAYKGPRNARHVVPPPNGASAPAAALPPVAPSLALLLRNVVRARRTAPSPRPRAPRGPHIRRANFPRRSRVVRRLHAPRPRLPHRRHRRQRTVPRRSARAPLWAAQAKFRAVLRTLRAAVGVS